MGNFAEQVPNLSDDDLEKSNDPKKDQEIKLLKAKLENSESIARYEALGLRLRKLLQKS